MLSKKIKKALIEKYGCKDFIYGIQASESDLQIDHRIPYEINGEPDKYDADQFMLLSNSTNRMKSWNCEQCLNWQEIKDKIICLSCYWAYPEDYTHVAMQEIRRVDLIWRADEIKIFEAIKNRAKSKEVQEFIKELLAKAISAQN